MCNSQNVRDVVDELLKYLEIADFTMRDELVLKTAVLAERLVCSATPAENSSKQPVSDARSHLRARSVAGT